MKKFITTEVFPEPNYTQVPNRFFEMLSEGMESSEVRVTLIMIRETYGFHRKDFKMGLNKLAEAAGLSRGATKDGAEAAEKRGTFRRTNPESQGEAEWELAGSQSLTPLNDYIVGSQPLDTPYTTIDPQVRVKESKEIIKPDLLDGILEYQLKPQAIRKAFSDYFKLTPNWEAKYNRQFLEWMVEMQVTPEQVQRAANLWRSDKRFNWSHPNLKGIQEHWLELIEEKPEEKIEYTRLL